MQSDQPAHEECLQKLLRSKTVGHNMVRKAAQLFHVRKESLRSKISELRISDHVCFGLIIVVAGFSVSPATVLAAARTTSAATNSEAASTEAAPVSKARQATEADRIAQSHPAARSVARPITRDAITSSLTRAAPVERAETQNTSRATSISLPARAEREAAASPRNMAAPARISIRASEPETTPSVRPADVQPFQKIGAPYQVNGTWYIPAHEPDYDEVGVASWYGRDFHGKATANGETFDMNVVTAAHPTLPIPSLVEVTNLSNGRSMVVRINDRGPFVSNRLIDLSARGAELLGYREQGSTQVRVRYIGPADPDPLVTAETLSPPSLEPKWAEARASAPKSPPNIPPARASNASGPSVAVTVARVIEQRPSRAVNRDGVASSETRAGLYVQAGAFSRQANAERAVRQLSDVGAVQIAESETASGATLYRVLIGPVRTQAEAQELADLVSNRGLSGAHVMASLN